MSTELFKNVIYKMCLEIIYLIHIYEEDLALINLQWLIYHQTKSERRLVTQYMFYH